MSKNSKDFDGYTEELSKRSIDSLSDAISDTLPALNDSLKSLRRNTQVVRTVEDPTLQHDETAKDTQGESDGRTTELMDKDDYLNSI